MIKVCPQPDHWSDIYSKLLRHHEKNGGGWKDAPPMGYAFDGWNWTSDVEKHARWIEMQEWAESHDCSALTEGVPEDGWYFVEALSDKSQGPYREEM